MNRGTHRAGEIVAERFQLLAQVGSGGMGAVWRARHLPDGDLVALKLLHADEDDAAHARERFLREARALRLLRSPHIVRVLDSGIDSGIPFIAMELLSGETLATRLRRESPLSADLVRRMVSEVASGIHVAHAAGIVHRDLKPDNIFVARTDDGSPAFKILDFGVAKTLGAPLQTLTRTGVMVGTPTYMSPEQVDGREPDRRSDLWALAVITYECLVGARPFHGNSLATLCFAICEDQPPVPSTVRAGLPRAFDDWFLKGVARNPDERFQSATEMAHALTLILSGMPAEPVSELASAAPALAALVVQLDGEPQLLEHFGDRSRAVKARVNALVHDTTARLGGRVIETDRVYAFLDPHRAIQSALEVQRALDAERWPDSYQVTARIGIGDASRANTVSGVNERDLLHARELCELAHGGQIVVAQDTVARVRWSLSDGVKLVDLGEHAIDADRRERVFQVSAPGLRAQFPPLRSPGGPPVELPSEASEFVGRAAELRAIEALLPRHPLVTLHGPGGAGKSRLAVRVAAGQHQRFRHGIFFVPLAAVRDAALVVPTVASVLGVAEQAGQSALAALLEHLAPREILLVLDNVEHLLDAAGEIAQLVGAGAGVRVLATSRAALDVPGEIVHDVGPLDAPALDASPAALRDNEAVQLFVNRARRAIPDFTVTSENATAIATIVRRLDGLPLALELAAARLGELSLADVAAQLGRDPTTLHDETGQVALRHRALADVVGWSYDRLDAEARVLFRRLAIFVGGFTRAVAGSVVAQPPVRDLDAGLTTLMSSSLLRRDTRGQTTRFAMLEPIREFALAALRETPEMTVVARRHAEAMAALVSVAAPALKRQGGVVREQLLLEDGNLRTALDFCLRTRDGELGTAIASDAWRYWQSIGRLQEGRRWLLELLACTDVTRAMRARGLDALAGLAYWQADYSGATRWYTEALEMYRELNDRLAIGETLFALSTTATWSGDSARGEQLARQALEIFEELGASEQIGMVRMAQGFALWVQGDLRAARPLWETSIKIAREAGDRVEAAHKTLALAAITWADGRRDAALRQAIQAMDELLEHHNVALVVMAIDFIASMLVHDDAEVAARLSGAATQLRGRMGGGMRPEACGLPNVARVASDALGAQDFQQAFERGRKLQLQSAIELARTVSLAGR